MKILKLKFKNLNSLKGEWSIDFTTSDFNSGIFAITGPTGSGKTTILDALCLGIYGRSPRETARKSENEIMSKGTGDCFSEVEFECNDFIYLTRFEQARARKNPLGKLQDTVCYLYKEENGDKKLVLKESSSSKYADKIAEEIGLTYSQFTKSVLLAQGAFTEFLKSDKNNKTQILEKITKTDFFRKISIKVFEKYQYEKKLRDDIIAKKDSLKLLTDEEENNLKSDLILKEKLIEGFEKDIKNKRNLKEVYTKKLEAEKKLKELEISVENQKEIVFKNECEFNQIQEEKINFDSFFKSKMDKIRTALAENKSIEEKTNFLKRDKKSLNEEISIIEKQKNDLKIVENDIVVLKEKIANLELKLKETEIDHSLLDEFTRIEVKFDLLNGQKEKEQNLKNELNLLVDEINKLETESAKLREQNINLKSSIDILKTERKEKYNDLSLLDVQEKLFNLKNCLTKLNNAKEYDENTKELSLNIEISRKQIESRHYDLKNILYLLEKSKSEKDKLESDIDNFENSLKFINNIMEYDEARKTLQDGKPCPLCGSLEHPYAIGNIPQSEIYELKLKELKSNLKSKEAEFQNFISKKSKFETEVSFLDKNMKSFFEKYNLISKELVNICKELNISPENILTEIEKTSKDIEDTELTYSSLKSLDLEIENLTSKFDKNSDLFNSYLNEIEKIKVKNSSLEKNISEIGDNIKNISLELNDYFLKYGLTFGDDTIVLLKERKKVREQDEKSFDELKRKLSEKQISIESLKNNLDIHINLCSKLEESVKNISLEIENLQNKIAKLFEDDETYSGSPQKEEDKLNQQSEDLDKRYSSKKISFEKSKIELDSKKENLKNVKNIIDEISLKISEDIDVNSLDNEIISFENKIKDITTEIGGINIRLSDNEKVKYQSKKILEEIEERKRILNPWEKLNDLIGSATGDKYQGFAQKITLSFLLKNANKYLEKISGRYILSIYNAESKTKKEDMPLYVKDLEQGGIVRPVSNLSGGETFMISLALALGLSSMSRKNIKIDSLFIDEGFATLDEYSLANALYVLNSLAGEGKTVGVISHVESLKDTIKTKIEIEKIAEGRSKISGAGVSKG